MGMHRNDEILELATDFLHSYVGFVVPIFEGYKQRDTLIPKWLEETLPVYLGKLSKYVSKDSPYLSGKTMGVGDIVMFSHFWKLAINPEHDQDFGKKIIAQVKQHEGLNLWCTKMQADLKTVFPKLIKSAF